jgi:Thioesterase superfamily
MAPVDLKVYFLRPVLPDGRDLVARGTVIHRGRSMAVGTSDVFDADGKKVALATGSAVILPGRPATVTTELTLPPLDGSERRRGTPLTQPAPTPSMSALLADQLSLAGRSERAFTAAI